MDVLSVNRRWAKNVTNIDESFQIIPQLYTVRELVDMLEITKHHNQLHLVVMGERLAEPAAKDKEDEDTLGDNQTFSRMDLIISCNSRV